MCRLNRPCKPMHDAPLPVRLSRADRAGPAQAPTIGRPAGSSAIRPLSGVEQEQWGRPELPLWSERLVQVLRESSRPTLIVAHSFGCLTTMHATGLGMFNLAGALLVAPADLERFGVVQALRHAPCAANLPCRFHR